MGSLLTAPASRFFEALQRLRWLADDRSEYWRARLRRRRMKRVIFVGITGSAGKTTTKDLAAGILATHGRCHASWKSGNDHHGIARTILDTGPDHRYCVVEVGAQHPGYLDRGVRLLQPRIAVLTVIAKEHLGAFRSNEAVAQEKRKLVDALGRDGTAVLNVDDALVREIGEQFAARTGRRVVWVGTDERATLRLVDASSRWPDPLTLELESGGRRYTARTRLHGAHLAVPALCALGVALAAGMALEDAIAALARIEPPEGRMQIVESDDGVVFLRDDWKAPVWSLALPFEYLREARAARKVVVLGTVSDSQRAPAQRYRRAGTRALEVADVVVMVGAQLVGRVDPASVGKDRSLHAFASIRDAAAFLRRELRRGDLVLLKGTNRQDHLVRLVLDRSQPVQCWLAGCQRQNFCSSCPQLHVPNADTAIGAVRGRRAATHEAGAARTLAANADFTLIVALGNPGERFRDTPHSVARRIVDALASEADSDWTRVEEGMLNSIDLAGQPVRLFKPDAQVNRSGTAIRSLVARLGVPIERCIVVHDDVDLALGDARLKRGGGDGGHKGVRSVIAELGTGTIRRVRIGVRRAGDARKARELVLEPFADGERQRLEQGLKRAQALLAEALEHKSTSGSSAAAAPRAGAAQGTL